MKLQKLLITALLINPTAIYAGLNDTGITTCSNQRQNGLPCPVAGFPGQDAEYGTNSFDFTKLDANGNAMAVTATNHSCVKDNVTGLIWEVKTDDGGLRYKDNRYTFDEAATFAANVNATNLCGHNDWRVPDIKELANIVDYSIAYPGPTIDTNYFPNTPPDRFWSSSPNVGKPGYAWLVDFGEGDDYYNGRSITSSVRLVCARQSLSFVFIDNANGTITDSSTGLIWAKCPLGQAGTNCEIGSGSELTWSQTLNAAKNSTLAGRNDWRVPNIQELRSIVDYTTYNPSINNIYFPNTPAKMFWTNLPSASYTGNAWFVDFDDGGDQDSVRSTSRVRLVCCVVPVFALNVTKAGNGAGSITSNPAGINCGSDCNENYASGTSVTLTATPATGSSFAGYSGDADCSDGTVTMNANKNCTATFNLAVTAPTVTTTAATNLTPTTATLNGSVTSNGATATVNFNFGTTTNYGQTIAAVPAQINSNTTVTVTGAATGLTCNTTYHYNITAVNSAGTTNGTDQSFTTATCPGPTVNPPTVVNGNPTNITPTSATLNGMVNANGAATTINFEFGLTTTYGTNITAVPATIAADAVNVTITGTASGLTCATTYNYRLTATNSAGAANGINKQFTTADCPPIDNDKHPRALIIGGKTSTDDPLSNEISPAIVHAYLALQAQGYATGGKHDVQVFWNGIRPSLPSGATLPVSTITVADFAPNTALTNWAKQASRLIIYMLGHGNTNIFYLDNTTNQILTADTMQTWLNLVKPAGTTSDNDITLIYEACYSGSFLNKLAAPNRILLTSASSDQRALMNNLNSYSYSLWSMLAQGNDLGISQYRAEQDMINRPNHPQTPQLDADGNGIPNQATSDRPAVSGRCIGILNNARGCIVIGAPPPAIEAVATNQTLNGETTANLWLKITAAHAASVNKAWGVIVRPDFTPNDNQAFDQLPTINLTPDATNQRWSGNYTQFNVAGTYSIYYYVKDHDSPSVPQVSTVTQHRSTTPQANLESPQQGSYESGIGLIRGWACQANTIEIQIDGGSKRQVAYGTARGDTQTTCGHSNTGFGFTYNWNALSNGTHNLKVFADNVQFADVNFTTTNLGSNYLTGASGQHTVSNFPSTGKTATLKWSEPHQNFVIASATRTTPKIMPPVIRPGITGNLESPQQNSFESGIGLIRGWVCQANSIELQIDNGTRRPVAYGTARGDTAATCNGNPNTGFGYVYNWNALSDGTHNLRLFVNNQEFTNVNFTVTTLGGNYLEGLSRDETFNFNGRNIKVRWATPHQNFVIVPL